ncbi:TetR/AcrR family transcriptional regulator [Aliamphritea ceti]|uniref:TetR/AcrR family transcriptional regulator n=1 Tax=Aliamphritea ceti TaxID=1524258 RepID=UPI0021C3CB09|nr:TetR/AcrR family transcriptional regulator [Aliamphritea ceti]
MVVTTKYDRQDAIERATDLFWEKGFHATSMRNIQQAIDMRPGSIYASFGSKDGLFKETLQYYAHNTQERIQAYVEAAESPLKGLKLFIQDSVIGCQESTPSGMCMLVKTVSELTQDNADLLAEAKLLIREIEATFAEVLVQAQACGELDQAGVPERMARYLQVHLMGLRAYVRANDGDDQISELIDDMFENLG